MQDFHKFYSKHIYPFTQTLTPTPTLLEGYVILHMHTPHTTNTISITVLNNILTV
jgi:hypothetical protein